MADQPRFVLRFDDSANEVNRRPSFKGEYQLAGEDSKHEVSLWSGVDQNGRIYARGKATPESASAAIQARAGGGGTVEAPPKIDLKVGEAVIFQTDKAEKARKAANDPEKLAIILKQPDFFGYAREADRYVKLTGWERGRTITGNVEAYRPGANGGPAPVQQAPKVAG